MIDFGRNREKNERELLHEMLDFIGDELRDLGSERELAHIEKIIAEGTGADRQLRVWRQSGGDLKAVVDHIIAETSEDLVLPSRLCDYVAEAA